MNTYGKKLIMLLLAGVLGLAMFSLLGCKKETPAAAPAETKDAVSVEIEQKTCPVMGGEINKDLFTEYKGKKVYFCCPGCKEQFQKEPEKYISKLPQFSK